MGTFYVCTVVGGMRANLEIQVRNEGDFPNRTLFNRAREYSTTLKADCKNHSGLPRTIVISIVAFPLFECVEFYSEYRLLEVTRHDLLTDKMCLCYFELPKLPEIVDGNDGLKLWLSFFKAKTEADLVKLQSIGGTIMTPAVEAYRSVSASGEFKELERLRARARQKEKPTSKAKYKGGSLPLATKNNGLCPLFFSASPSAGTPRNAPP